MTKVTIRHSDAGDAQKIKQIYEDTSVYSNTLQLPYPDGAVWEQRVVNKPANVYSLVAEIDDEIVGNLGCMVCESQRRRHTLSFGMARMSMYTTWLESKPRHCFESSHTISISTLLMLEHQLMQ
jgi:putative acetyltransferase